ncbi:MAG: ATPase, T2SS/T4P/T4SS family [Acidimicrobiales bacterium]
MSDVDAIRYLASEHDLEFVDLDSYAVDAAAAELLPEAVARAHHVVALKRKFGTPVIAIADPDDVFALDTLRASIGRDFISVVASREQIGALLDRFYGASDNGDDVAVVADEALGLSLFGSAFLPSEAVVEEGPAAVETGPTVPDAEAFEPEAIVEQTGNGNASHPNVEPLSIDEAAESNGNGASPGLADDSEWQDLMTEPIAPPVEPGPDPLVGVDDVASEEVTEATAAVEVPDTDEAGPLEVGPDAEGPGSTGDAPTVVDESAMYDSGQSPLADFTFDTTLATPDALAASADELAEFARAVEIPMLGDSIDSVSATADLVDEAVASFEEQHSDLDQGAGVTSTMPAMAQALIEGDRVSLADMESVIEEHDRSGQSIARILTARKLVTEADLMWGMAREMDLEFVDLDTIGVNYTASAMIPEATARHHNVLVIAEDAGTPIVAASNPTDVFAMDDLRTIIGRSFTTVVATRSQIGTYIGRAYHGGGDAEDMAKTASLEFDRDESSIDDIQAITEEAPIVRYVNLLVVQALNERASDIHVEPTAKDLRIRYRIDGVLHDVSTAPRSIAAAVTTRLKVMADMNIAEHRIPQDGRISLNVGSKGVDLRMATLPTIHGEKIVMRVLDKSSVVLGFPDLGFDDDLLATYEGIFTKPYGTILVTGPTGSGKSTTLYTTLTALNSPEKNIITVEDPVELQLQGVNQVQLNLKAGLTFASALKSILRSDPDIVLVGEIRDKETAVIAVEAALTGHLVLATLHTNSASSTPMRLVEMGLEPFLVTSSITAVLAQRLARRLCMHCKEPYDVSEAEILAAGWRAEEMEELANEPTFFRAVGCSACSNTGYRGRKALAELMPMSEEIERLIIEGGAVEDIHRMAVSQGMITLRQSGLRKAMEGETTLEEVLRVVA